MLEEIAATVGLFIGSAPSAGSSGSALCDAVGDGLAKNVLDESVPMMLMPEGSTLIKRLSPELEIADGFCADGFCTADEGGRGISATDDPTGSTGDGEFAGAEVPAGAFVCVGELVGVIATGGAEVIAGTVADSRAFGGFVVVTKSPVAGGTDPGGS